MSGEVPDSNKVSLTIKSGNPFGLTGDLSPLAQTNGVVFPYTPTIQFGYAANYGSYDLTHSLYPTNYFINNPPPSIGLTATFTAQDQADADYSAAALHFFRAATKMEYGQQTRATGGTPPAILLFSAYGIHARRVPVIIKSFNYTLVEDADYVTVSNGGSIPTSFLISLDLTVQYPPSTVRRQFNLGRFASGAGLQRRFI